MDSDYEFETDVVSSEEKERGEIWLEEGLEEDAEDRDGVEELDV